MRSGPASLHLEVQAGADVRPRRLTTDVYGGARWPTLQGALDTLVTMPRSATLVVAGR